MPKEHIKLSQADRDFLMIIISKGQLSARVFKRATALLELNRGQTLGAVAETLQVSYQTVAHWRDNYQSSGLQALEEKPRAGRPRPPVWQAARSTDGFSLLNTAGRPRAVDLKSVGRQSS